MKSLIIFARYPRPGEVKTRLGRVLGMERAAAIYSRFARHAFSIGEVLLREGVTVYLYYDPSVSETEMRAWVDLPFAFVPQEGEDLGERMRRAFEQTFENGSERSVIIGTDVPELGEATVQQAFDRLDDHPVVLGPGDDGGYYLLGMVSPVKDLFSGVRWSTGQVMDQTMARVGSLGLDCSLLPVHHDVDTAEDYAAFCERNGIKP